MCDFCKYIRKAETENDYNESYIRQWDSGTFELFLGNGGSWDSGTLRNIHYCPICGRRLSEVSK